MAYRSLRACVNDLEKNGYLLRIKSEVDPNLEMAEIHLRIHEAGGPAILFENVKGSPFQAVSNIYGTKEQTEFLFRKTIPYVQKVIELKADPANFFKNPLRYLSAPFTALNALPKRSRIGSACIHETTIDQLPQVKSWKDDGGAFVTLPQVFTLPPGKKKNVMQSNMGMYRIQLSGNEYIQNEEIGLHYQLHRGIGVHHTAYNESDEPFRCSVFIGGPPSHAFCAIMPLPEGLSEWTFAGMLGGRRVRYHKWQEHFISSDADFCIVGTIQKNKKKPEGPFGDHLGYYSLQHDFPVMKVEKVFYRKDPLWHFTVVGRPPQEDSNFGYLISKLVKLLAPQEFPGVKEINAVDAAGVHPLLLAVGSERYMPFRERKPEEILTQANRILGSGQTSLAKFLIIAATGDGEITCHDIPHFMNHVLERIDWRRDLHFHTRTTIDTLDYSGSGWNEGSKVIMACCGDKLRELTNQLPDNFNLPTGYAQPTFCQNGVLAISSPKWESHDKAAVEAETIANHLGQFDLSEIPLVILTDDAPFAAETLNNFVWTTFTRANPSHDIYGVKSSVQHKHWGCEGALIIDARVKLHHAPPLIKDEEIVRRVDALFLREGIDVGKLDARGRASSVQVKANA